PFFASETALLDKQTVIYLDDSFSMQAKSDGTTLMENAIQSLIKSIPQNQKFTLFTNEKVFDQVSLPEVQNDLLALVPSPKQLDLNEIYSKGNTFFDEDRELIKHIIIISDFQERMASADVDSLTNLTSHFVKLTPETNSNISIDSIYIDTQDSDNIELKAVISRIGSIENTPVSLFNENQLIAKSSAVFGENQATTVQFTVPKNERLNGRLELSDVGLVYDNQLFFTIDADEKIKVIAIGEADADYLKRIYTNDAFEFNAIALNKLNYGDLEKQNLIILNELSSISTALGNSLKSFTNKGGGLAIIPSNNIDINSYNILTSNYFLTSFLQKVEFKKAISRISFSHPLYRNVFEKNVTNFQFPEVNHYYKINTNASSALTFQDNAPFLVGDNSNYLFTASFSTENSNFKNSPLIVPTFYQIAVSSLKLAPLYSILGEVTFIDVAVSLSDDTILKVVKDDYEFIPRQQALSNKVSLTFDDDIQEDGNFAITQNDTYLRGVSFNYDRKESKLNYTDMNTIEGAENIVSITSLFDSLEKEGRIQEHWKWFAILALILFCVEILLQKFMR
ncbi:hypothetical protein LCGC14_1087830, partial [marine sediment metagenome]